MPLAAYFDESGTNDNDPALVMAGFVSDVERWAEFSEKWQAAMDEWEIPFWHMADFESRKQQFAKWPKNDDRINLRLQYLLGLINEYTLGLVSTAFPRSLFDAFYIPAPKRQERLYQATAGCSLGMTYGLQLGRSRGEDLALIFERGAKGRHQVQQSYDRVMAQDFARNPVDPKLRVVSMTFGCKEQFQPLQAADILAYEEFKQYGRTWGNDPRETRYPLRSILNPAHITARGVVDIGYLQWAMSIVEEGESG